MRNSVVRDSSSRLAAGASAAAGAIHLAVTPGHLSQWWGYGAFFASLAIFQLVWAALVLRSTRPLVTGLGIGVNGAVIAIWAVSRMTGIGVGPDAARAHTIGWPDAAAVIVELVVVVQSARLLTGRHRRRGSAVGRAPWLGVALAVAGTALTASAVAAAAVAPEHDHSHPTPPVENTPPGHHSEPEAPADTPGSTSDHTPTGPVTDDERSSEHHVGAESHSH